MQTRYVQLENPKLDKPKLDTQKLHTPKLAALVLASLGALVFPGIAATTLLAQPPEPAQPEDTGGQP